MKNIDLAVQFFLQIAVILFFCRLVGPVQANDGGATGADSFYLQMIINF